MILILLSFLAQASELTPSLGESHYRCVYASPSHRVLHHFTLPKDSRISCDYAIEVDGKVILQSRAFTEDCRDFVRIQINKGSVCMTDELD